MKKDWMLQLFAEAQASDIMQSTGETEAVAAPPASGEETASAAGMQQDLKAEFDTLIKGKYKPFFDERVQDILKKRLKETKAPQTAAVTGDTTPVPDTASAEGAPPSAEKASDPAVPEADPMVAAQVAAWQEQAAALVKRYPNFSLQEALSDPRFARLILGGADMEAAYEVLNKDKLLPQAMAYTARLVSEKLSGGLRSRENCPGENGTAGASAAVVRPDVSQMTPRDRAEIIRRVRNGERISF